VFDSKGYKNKFLLINAGGGQLESAIQILERWTGLHRLSGSLTKKFFIKIRNSVVPRVTAEDAI